MLLSLTFHHIGSAHYLQTEAELHDMDSLCLSFWCLKKTLGSAQTFYIKMDNWRLGFLGQEYNPLIVGSSCRSDG